MSQFLLLLSALLAALTGATTVAAAAPQQVAATLSEQVVAVRAARKAAVWLTLRAEPRPILDAGPAIATSLRPNAPLYLDRRRE